MIGPFTERFTNLISEIHRLISEIFTDKSLRIGYLTVFAQSKDDYNSLRSVLSQYGDELEANNGIKYVLYKPLQILSENVETIRIRKPDIHRPELGCCDLVYKEEDYVFLELKLWRSGWILS
jgi:hypothetical protein